MPQTQVECGRKRTRLLQYGSQTFLYRWYMLEMFSTSSLEEGYCIFIPRGLHYVLLDVLGR